MIISWRQYPGYYYPGSLVISWDSGYSPSGAQTYYGSATITLGLSISASGGQLIDGSAVINFYLFITAYFNRFFKQMRNSLGIKDDRIIYPKRRSISK